MDCGSATSVLLVHPQGEGGSSCTAPYESLTLGSLAEILARQGCAVTLHDLALDPSGREGARERALHADVVVIDALYRTLDEALEIAVGIRRNGRWDASGSTAGLIAILRRVGLVETRGREGNSQGFPLVGLTGLGVQARADEILATTPWIDFVLAPRSGTPHLRPWRPYAVQSIVGRGVIDVEATRGCAYSCSFCAVSALTSRHRVRRWIPRRPVDIVEEIRCLVDMTGVRKVNFVDDNFLGSPRGAARWLRELAAEMARSRLDIAFSIYVRADACTPDAVRRMVEVGLVQAHLGVESGSDTVLARLGKRTTRAAIEASLAGLRRHGVEVVPSLIVFEPRQTLQETLESLEWIHDQELERGFGPSTIIPLAGAPIVDELVIDGLLSGEPSFSLETPTLADPHVARVADGLRRFESRVQNAFPGWLEELCRERFVYEDRLEVAEGLPSRAVRVHDEFRRRELLLALQIARHELGRSRHQVVGARSARC